VTSTANSVAVNTPSGGGGGGGGGGGALDGLSEIAIGFSLWATWRRRRDAHFETGTNNPGGSAPGDAGTARSHVNRLASLKKGKGAYGLQSQECSRLPAEGFEPRPSAYKSASPAVS